MDFKEGDKVRIIKLCTTTPRPEIGEICTIKGGCAENAKGYYCGCEGYYELVESSNNKSIMSSLKEKMALVFKGEPEKSFIKAGVMNSDETLTSDGQAVFLAWLLKKNGDVFKTEVIDPILADDKESE